MNFINFVSAPDLYDRDEVVKPPPLLIFEEGIAGSVVARKLPGLLAQTEEEKTIPRCGKKLVVPNTAAMPLLLKALQRANG